MPQEECNQYVDFLEIPKQVELLHIFQVFELLQMHMDAQQYELYTLCYTHIFCKVQFTLTRPI